MGPMAGPQEAIRMPSEARTVPAAAQDPQPTRRPNLTGDLDTILANLPTFRSRVRGYDRLQVDNYVRWAETEMHSSRREVDDLAARYGLCVAEVKNLRQLAAESPEARQMRQVSERIGQMLRLAADEAAAVRAAGIEEAERVVDDARTEAEAHLGRAREVEEAAVAKADRLQQEIREAVAQADAALLKARDEAARLLAEASAERDRLAERAAAERAAQEEQARAAREAMLAEAAVRVAAIEDDLADLGNQRNQARECLARLSTQITEALDALAEGLPRDVRVPQNGQNGQNGSRAHVLAGNMVAPG
jgi:cell division septum initiation protein DivIVA